MRRIGQNRASLSKSSQPRLWARKTSPITTSVIPHAGDSETFSSSTSFPPRKRSLIALAPFQESMRAKKMMKGMKNAKGKGLPWATRLTLPTKPAKKTSAFASSPLYTWPSPGNRKEKTTASQGFLGRRGGGAYAGGGSDGVFVSGSSGWLLIESFLRVGGVPRPFH